METMTSTIAVKPEFQNPSCLISYTCKPSLWVKLADWPNDDGDDEALLLCQQSEDEWVAWVTNHGETILNNSQFYYF